MQILLNGIISGSAIALLAVAFQLIYLPTRVFFLSMAGIYSAVPYLAGAVLLAGGGWPLAFFTGVAAASLLSVACEWSNHARLARRKASEGAHLIAALGVNIILVHIIAMIWGNETRTLRTGLDSVVRFGDVIITGAQWKTALVALVLLSGLGILLMRSNIGLRLRALADNPAMFGLFGYNVDQHRLAAFALGGVFAAVSSMATAHDIGFDPYGGLHALLLAVVAVIIGGRDTFLGPVLGAILLGVLRAQVVWHFSARWQEAATFGLLAIFLLLRPQGLLGQKSRLEAA